MKRYFKKGKGCCPVQKPDEILPPGDAGDGMNWLVTITGLATKYTGQYRK